MSRIVRVTLDDLTMPEGPIVSQTATRATVQGRDVVTDERVSFGVNQRTLRAFMFALDGDGEFEVELP